MEPTPFDLVRELFQQLRWRRFPLGVTDLAALRNSLAAGFGWSSSEAFRELIVALWAKSARRGRDRSRVVCAVTVATDLARGTDDSTAAAPGGRHCATSPNQHVAPHASASSTKHPHGRTARAAHRPTARLPPDP